MPIENFYLSFYSTHNKQQAGIKYICTDERGKKVMTATNMCSNFGVFRCSPPLTHSVPTNPYSYLIFNELLLFIIFYYYSHISVCF